METEDMGKGMEMDMGINRRMAVKGAAVGAAVLGSFCKKLRFKSRDLFRRRGADLLSR